MNSMSASMPLDNIYNQDDPKSNKESSVPLIKRKEKTEYSEEEHHLTHILIKSFNDSDDVSEEQFQNTTEVQARRISDTIDSNRHSPSLGISNRNCNFDVSESNITDNWLSDTQSITVSSDLGCSSFDLNIQSSNLNVKHEQFNVITSSSESSPPKVDTTIDSEIVCAPIQEQQVLIESDNSRIPIINEDSFPLPVYTEASMTVTKWSFEYNMNFPRVGDAIIFNHEQFLNGNTYRRGTSLDAKRLHKTLKDIGFRVEINHDLSLSSIEERINKLGQQNHSDCDCVLVAVMSHGDKNGYIMAHDHAYHIDMLCSPLANNHCPTLAGKPKIFLIQACRGDKRDVGIELVDNDSGFKPYSIPAMADFLLAYSTVEGYYSYRNPDKGTWFIQSFCDILKEAKFEYDLYTLLTIVSQKVALEYTGYSTQSLGQYQLIKQVPQIVSTLIRKVQFKRKPQSSSEQVHSSGRMMQSVHANDNTGNFQENKRHEQTSSPLPSFLTRLPGVLNTIFQPEF